MHIWLYCAISKLMAYFHDTRERLIAHRNSMLGKVLDYGAGGGKNRLLLTPNQGVYVAFDLTPPIDGVVGDVHSAPFADSSFDVVVCNQVLEHVPRPTIVVREIYRLVKHGGLVLVTAPFMFPYHADPGDYFRYSQSGLSEIFREAGFSIIDAGTIGGPASVVSDAIRMTIANPYQRKPSAMRRRVVRYADAIARRVNRMWKSDIIYTNAYVLAKK